MNVFVVPCFGGLQLPEDMGLQATFSKGAEPSLPPKIFQQRPKNCSPNLTKQHAMNELHITGWNEFHFFHLLNTKPNINFYLMASTGKI